MYGRNKLLEELQDRLGGKIDVNGIMSQARGWKSKGEGKGKGTGPRDGSGDGSFDGKMPIPEMDNTPQPVSKGDNTPQPIEVEEVKLMPLDNQGGSYKYSEKDLQEIMKKPFNKISEEEMHHIRKYQDELNATPPEDGKQPLDIDNAAEIKDKADDVFESEGYDDLEKALKIFFPKENPKDVIVRLISNSLNK